MAGRGWIWTFVGLFAFSGGCQVVGDLEPELVLASGDEVCGDGLDDDEDGLTDCADPDCGAGACVPGAPPGWEGPFLVKRGPWDGASGPSCPGMLAGTAHYLSPTPAACTPCTCGDVEGGACGAPKLRCWPSTNCTGNGTNASVQNVGVCDNPYGQQSPPVVSCRIDAQGDLESSGTCVAIPGQIADTRLFQEILSACALGAEGGGCTEGAACAPPLEEGAQICVRSASGGVCPNGWTGEVIDAFASAQDARACTTCECKTSSNVCAGGVYRIFDTASCQLAMPGANVDPPVDITGEACVDLTMLADLGTISVRAVDGGAPAGGCMPNGGGANGAVQPQGPVKYCCR